jgi:hypothetical protein
MEIAIGFGLLALVCFGFGIWFQRKVGDVPRNFTSVDYPVPQVAFPFEPLNELVAECAKKFEHYPLRSIPVIKLSPASYLPKNANVIYHPKSNQIYMNDKYAAAVTPESLADTISSQLVYAWLWQHRQSLFGDLKLDERLFTACQDVGAALLGLRKSNV